MKKSVVKWFVFVFTLIFISACGGSSKSSSKSSSSTPYSIDNSKNNAVMGPLRDATVNIYRFGDLNKSIETVKTDKFGAFSVKLDKIPDDELLLVTVSGGYDIDSNDDGILDESPVKNNGTIHALATKNDLKNGKCNVTLVSEVIFQYIKPYLNDPHYTQEDIKNMIKVLTKYFVKDNNYSSLLKFNPIDKKSKQLLKMDYSKFLGLASLYHNNKNKEEIKKAIRAKFYDLPFTIGDTALANVKSDFVVSITPSSHITFTTSEGNGTTYKLKKDKNFTVSINSIDTGYKILSWNGCDYVSSDLKICKIFNIHEDRNIVPFVVPTKIEINSSVVIRDISNAYVIIDTNATNSTITSMEVYSDLKDKNTTQTFANMNLGDILVHDTDPVFFGKLVKKTKINDFRYKIDVEKVPLESIVSEGYIASEPVKVGTYGSSTSTRVLSRSVILPNGKEIKFDPNQPANITIEFKGDNAVIYPTTNKKYIKKRAEYPYSTEALGVKLKGKLTITPENKFGISWSLLHGLDQVYLKSGIVLKNDLTITKTGDWEVSKKVPLGKYTFTQTLLVGIVPVQVKEEFNLYLGASANAKSGIKLDNNIFFYPYLEFSWSKSNKDLNIKFERSLKNSVFIYGNADAFAYLGVYPKIKIYGVGIGMDNKFGPYFSINGKASSSSDLFGDDEVKVAAGLYGEYGLKYEGVFNLVTTWKLLNRAIEEINKLLPGEGRIEKTWKFGTVDAKDALRPGKLEISGDLVSNVEKTEGDSLSISKVYTLKNVGEKNVTFYAAIKNAKELDTVIYSDISDSKEKDVIKGVLEPGESTNIHVELSKDKLPLKDYSVKVEFKESNSTDAFWPIYPSKFTSIINIHTKSEELTFDKTELNATLVGVTTKRIKFNWNLKDNYDKLYGYIIYMANYNKDTDSCMGYMPYIRVHDGNKTYAYSNFDLETTFKEGQEYCFILTGFKKFLTEGGYFKYREYTLSDVAKLTPIPKSTVDTNTSDTNASVSYSKELDIMFLVDVSGSYRDDIATFKSKSVEIINSIKSALPKDMMLRVGLSSFSDYPKSPYGSSSYGDYPYRLDMPLTYDSNGSLFKNALSKLHILYGSDWPEAQLEGLYQTVTDSKIGWNPNAIKLIFLFTDAGFHDSDKESDYPGHGSSAVKSALEANNISVIGFGSGGIPKDMTNISSKTFKLSYDSAGVVDAIKEIIAAVPGTDVNITRSIDTRSLEPVYDPDYIGQPNN